MHRADQSKLTRHVLNLTNRVCHPEEKYVPECINKWQAMYSKYICAALIFVFSCFASKCFSFFFLSLHNWYSLSYFWPRIAAGRSEAPFLPLIKKGEDGMLYDEDHCRMRETFWHFRKYRAIWNVCCVEDVERIFVSIWNKILQ